MRAKLRTESLALRTRDRGSTVWHKEVAGRRGPSHELCARKIEDGGNRTEDDSGELAHTPTCAIEDDRGSRRRGCARFGEMTERPRKAARMMFCYVENSCASFERKI